jgi:hypothetical protein
MTRNGGNMILLECNYIKLLYFIVFAQIGMLECWNNGKVGFGILDCWAGGDNRFKDKIDNG